MIDVQTRQSVETMCLCGLDFEGLKNCFKNIDEADLKEVYDSVKNSANSSEDASDFDVDTTISCNCS